MFLLFFSQFGTWTLKYDSNPRHDNLFFVVTILRISSIIELAWTSVSRCFSRIVLCALCALPTWKHSRPNTSKIRQYMHSQNSDTFLQIRKVKWIGLLTVFPSRTIECCNGDHKQKRGQRVDDFHLRTEMIENLEQNRRDEMGNASSFKEEENHRAKSGVERKILCSSQWLAIKYPHQMTIRYVQWGMWPEPGHNFPINETLYSGFSSRPSNIGLLRSYLLVLNTYYLRWTYFVKLFTYLSNPPSDSSLFKKFSGAGCTPMRTFRSFQQNFAFTFWGLWFSQALTRLLEPSKLKFQTVDTSSSLNLRPLHPLIYTAYLSSSALLRLLWSCCDLSS